jgi:hypothetical protein
MQQPTVHPLPAVSGLLARFDAWLEQRERRATEAYLATSQNVAELEARIRDMTRGTPHPFY